MEPDGEGNDSARGHAEVIFCMFYFSLYMLYLLFPAAAGRPVRTHSDARTRGASFMSVHVACMHVYCCDRIRA